MAHNRAKSCPLATSWTNRPTTRQEVYYTKTTATSSKHANDDATSLVHAMAPGLAGLIFTKIKESGPMAGGRHAAHQMQDLHDGATAQDHPVDQWNWNTLFNQPERPYYIPLPLQVVNVYFAGNYLDRPNEPICNRLCDKLGDLTNAVMSTKRVKGAFYPTEYAH